MHTATQIRTDMFAVETKGAVTEPVRLLGLHERDRFGIIVNAPLGALGAGLLASLAITSFYDVPAKGRRERNLYPEIYLFHVGGPWGSHSSFDFWPEGKEVFVADDPVEALRAVNHYAITHLAVPERTPRAVSHRYREPETAIDRIRQCYVYHPTGTVENADVVIRSAAPEVLWNYEATLAPEIYLADMEESLRIDPQLCEDTPMAIDYRRVISYLRERWDEVSRNDPAYREAAARVAAAKISGEISERFRRVGVEIALMMLG